MQKPIVAQVHVNFGVRAQERERIDRKHSFRTINKNWKSLERN